MYFEMKNPLWKTLIPNIVLLKFPGHLDIGC